MAGIKCVRYHGPRDASPPYSPIPIQGQGANVTLSSSETLRTSESLLSIPPCADGHTEAKELAEREATDSYVPTQSSPAPSATSPGPRPPLPSLPSVAGATPPLAFSSLQEAPGRQVWELSLLRETPLSPAPACQGALARNWAKKGPSPSSLL